MTILQPWAHWIARGRKFVENRTWSTNYRGAVAIHAGLRSTYAHLGGSEADDYAYGAVVAVAWLTTCVYRNQIPRLVRTDPEMAWLLDHEHVEGLVCWVFSRVWTLAEPVLCSGRQGLWPVDDELVARIRAAYDGRAVDPVGRVRVARYGRQQIEWSEPVEALS